MEIPKEIKDCIYLYECEKNPHYQINPEIKIKNVSPWFGKGNNITVTYEVEYISKLDTKWRKWYNKEEAFSIDGFKSKIRDIRLNKLLDNPDN